MAAGLAPIDPLPRRAQLLPLAGGKAGTSASAPGLAALRPREAPAHPLREPTHPGCCELPAGPPRPPTPPLPGFVCVRSPRPGAHAGSRFLGSARRTRPHPPTESSRVAGHHGDPASGRRPADAPGAGGHVRSGWTRRRQRDGRHAVDRQGGPRTPVSPGHTRGQRAFGECRAQRSGPRPPEAGPPTTRQRPRKSRGPSVAGTCSWGRASRDTHVGDNPTGRAGRHLDG